MQLMQYLLYFVNIYLMYREIHMPAYTVFDDCTCEYFNLSQIYQFLYNKEAIFKHN